jgi:CheY-like chemotaxis protein
LTPEPLDLSFLIQQMNKTLRRLLGEHAEIEYAPCANLPAILADPHALENVIVNLVLNGRDAVFSGGKLTLSTAAVRISPQEAWRHNEARAGEFVCLKVRDTGCGMTPEVQERLFEPFFTTKDGKAMGLGLASVYGIVKQHSGWIECRNQRGQGTEFRVFFPCAPQSATAIVRNAQAARALEKQTILLIEPDDEMRAVARFILDRAGYCVVEADSASLALTLWESRAAKINLVITETSLPAGVSGGSLAEQLRRTKPELKIVYSHAADAPNGAEGANEFQALPLISKPYTASKLLQAIDDCLVEAGSSRS